MPLFSNVITVLGGATLVIGAAATVAWWIFQTLSAKWLDSKFNERLEAYKLAGAMEIARVQFTINAKLDRATKLHAQEFDVLPKAFDMLCAAGGAVGALIEKDPTYPDVSNASVHDLKILLAGSPLSEQEKEEIMASTSLNRQQTYVRVKRRYLATAASRETSELHNYLASKSIFIQPELRAKFLKASGLLSRTVEAHIKASGAEKSAFQMDVGQSALMRNRDAFKALNPLIDEIGAGISDRLWDRSTD